MALEPYSRSEWRLLYIFAVHGLQFAPEKTEKNKDEGVSVRFIIKSLIAVALLLVAGVAYAQSEYRIRAGDTLNIEVLEDTSLNRSVIVLPDGRVSYPLAGTIVAAGRTVEQIRATVAAAIAGNFAAPPNVFVSVQPAPRVPVARSEPAPAPVISVYLMGEVEKNGRIEVRPGTTFLQALAEAGGITPFAATKRIQLRRTDHRTNEQKVYTINYYQLSRGVALRNDVALQDGDVILVPERRLFE